MCSGPFCQHGFKVQLTSDSVEVWVSVGGGGRGGLAWPDAASVGMLAGTFPAGGSSPSQCHKALDQVLYEPGLVGARFSVTTQGDGTLTSLQLRWLSCRARLH